ncbi:hypothetical protein ACOSQ2_026574 [Xanthoceras sorbifolium]
MMAALLRNKARMANLSWLQPLLLIPRKRPIQSQSNLWPEFKGEEYMIKKIQQINKALDEAVPLQHPTMLHQAMRYTLLAGGKRLLPILCIASCELVGGNQSSVMPIACAFEMIKTEGLVLDDLPCMDNDDLRRGKPTNHKVFGEATSILASHALLCLAIEYVATRTKNVSPDRLIQAIAEICSTIGSKGATAGQFADLNSEGKEVSLSELEFIHKNKTGKILEASVACGVLVGGGNEEQIQILRKYAKCVGLAFQVWDDILDITGSTERLGKTAGKDLLCNKATYPKLMGMDESKKFARQLVAEAKEEVSCFDSTRAAPLHHLANFAVSRTM